MEAIAGVSVVVMGALVAFRWWMKDRAEERKHRAESAQVSGAELRQTLDKSLRDLAEVSERVRRLESRGIGAAARPTAL